VGGPSVLPLGPPLGMGAESRALEWEYLGGFTSSVHELHADPAHARLLVGTGRGYRIYEPASGTWILRETGDPYGNYKVHSFLTSDTDSLELFTGREDAYWYGYIMDNAGLTTLGPIVLEGWSMPGGLYETGAVRGLARLPGSPGALFACTGLSSCGCILRSLDGGLNWPAVYEFCETPAGANAIAVAPNGDIVVGYGNLGEVDNGVLRNSDGGDSWSEIAGDMPLAESVSGIAVDPSDPSRVYAKQGSALAAPDPRLGVYATSDGGLHWEQVLQGNVMDMCLHPEDGNVIAAIIDGVVLLSRVGGYAWEDVSGNLPLVGVAQCAILASDERIYVADRWDGMWGADLNPTATEQSPEVQSALSAFPNPFNPATSLSFTLERDGPASLDIVDIGGRVVRRLLAAKAMQAGRQTMAWDGRDAEGADLPSGLYFANLNAGGQRASLKLLLLK